MKKLSEIAWQQASHLIHASYHHPFNTQLANGSLAPARFSYYIAQDTLYLRDYARSLALIAAKAPLAYIRDFLHFADNALIAEQEMVHAHFRQQFGITTTAYVTPATLAYTSYLLQTSALAPIEVAVAAHLPCFWVYHHIGSTIRQHACSLSGNPYARWIETYASEGFSRNVRRAIQIFDEMGAVASPELQQRMLTAFQQSCTLEWHFWNDAYQQTRLDAVAQTSPPPSSFSLLR